jgi:hypothetical protein
MLRCTCVWTVAQFWVDLHINGRPNAVRLSSRAYASVTGGKYCLTVVEFCQHGAETSSATKAADLLATIFIIGP